VQASDYLELGTPDANGYPANSTGQVQFAAKPGDPSTPADEADVGIKVGISDVRDRTRDADPYVGEIQVAPVLRITDRGNGSGTSFTDAATGMDVPFNFGVACVPMPPAGSRCATTTTADAILPGMVSESDRTVWQVQRVDVFDGGPDSLAATADNTLFETQGLFVP
jgi:hypothetical protein